MKASQEFCIFFVMIILTVLAITTFAKKLRVSSWCSFQNIHIENVFTTNYKVNRYHCNITTENNNNQKIKFLNNA